MFSADSMTALPLCARGGEDPAPGEAWLHPSPALQLPKEGWLCLLHLLVPSAQPWAPMGLTRSFDS